MNIAQVAPLQQQPVPQSSGGVQRLVSHLTEELIRQGHHVTLFANDDVKTSANLASQPLATSLPNGQLVEYQGLYFMMLEEVFKRIDEFDVVHFHVDYVHFPYMKGNAKSPIMLTNRIDLGTHYEQEYRS